MMRIFRIFILCLAGLFLFGARSEAITISPTFILNELKPGSSARGEVRVYNEAEFPILVEVELSDWEFTKDGSGRVDFRPRGSTAFSAADWIQAEPMRFELAAKELKKVSYSLNMPSGSSGGYYAAIFFTAARKVPEPTEDSEQPLVLIQRARLAALIYCEPEGTQKKVSLTELTAERHSESAYLISYGMKNEGRGYVRSDGKYHIMDNQGRIYGSGALSAVKLQQGDFATGSAEWLGNLPAGEYSVIITLELKPFSEDIIVKEVSLKVEN